MAICRAGQNITQPNYGECADLFERKNGSTYREHVVGLPRELNKEQRLALVKEWIAQEVGDALFCGTAQRHSERWRATAHIHLMFCERLQDGIERTPQQFFKRYNSKDPSKGGARKDNTGKRPNSELEIKEQRLRWQEMANRHLLEAGFKPSIDVRNWKDKGIGRSTNQ